jgi:hypothetical protein
VIIRRIVVGAALTLLGAWACTDETPTYQDRDRIPVDAQTYQVFLPFEAFAADFQTFRGFGAVVNLGIILLANEWSDEDDPAGGTLEARPLVRFGLPPDSIFAPMPGNGGTEVDSLYVPVGGELRLVLDTAGLGEDPVNLQAFATEFPWHDRTASWIMAVDSVGEREPWPEAGGGPMRLIQSVSWFPSEGDTVIVEVDSVTATEWADRDAPHRGLLLATDAENFRTQVQLISYRTRVRPSVNPDTLIWIGPLGPVSTFIYDPTPTAAPGTFQIGGAPAQRATFRMDLPAVLDGDPEICQFIPCPLELRPGEILFASMVLETGPTDPVALRPKTDFPLAARVVLAPDRLPRSPLGRSVQPVARQIPSSRFVSGEEGSVEIPLTRYIQEIVGAMREGEAGPPRTVALLSQVEPRGLEIATFQAPGSAGSPMLRLVFTISGGVTLP